MSDQSTTSAPPVPGGRRRTPAWLGLAVAVFFGLFYAYDVWEAVGNLVGLNLQAQGLDTQLSAFGWTIVIAGVLVPALVFAIAAWLGRRRGLGVRALLLFVGLCVVAVLSLDIYVMFGLGRLIV